MRRWLWWPWPPQPWWWRPVARRLQPREAGQWPSVTASTPGAMPSSPSETSTCPCGDTAPPGPGTRPWPCATVPLWSSSIASGGKTYKFQMVGKNPFIKESAPSVTIGAPIVPVVFTFASGNAGGVFDPTQKPCGESLSDINLVKQSLIFTKLTYTDGGTKLGTGEYVDIFQRANFWKSSAARRRPTPTTRST